MKKNTIYEPPQRGALIKIFLSRSIAVVLFLMIGLIYAQSPGGVSGASLWLKADNGVNTVDYFQVPGANRTASSTYSGFSTANSVIDSQTSGWAAGNKSNGEYLTLDLGSSQTIYGVVTQGRYDYDQWVKSYTISYLNSNNINDTFTVLSAFPGNTDRSTKVINIFSAPVMARYIRITVTDFNDHPSMRADVIKKLTSVSADNSAASVWMDQSGANNHMIQTDNNKRPTYLNSASSRVNFNPMISFNGSNNEFTDVNGILGTGNYTNVSAFVVSAVGNVQNSSIFFEMAKNNSGGDSQFNLHAPWGNGYVYWDGINTSRIEAPWGGTVNTPYIWTGWNNAGLPTKTSLRRNGTQIASGTTMNNYNGQNKPMYIGSAGGGTFYNGKMGEVIIFRTELSADERIKVESYLALKYGTTLPSDYKLSDGTIVWSNSYNDGYNNDIAGIGRDNQDSGLYQKQSQSVNGGFQPVIGNVTIAATNAANISTFNLDKTALVWGSDTGSTTFATAFAFGELNNRMARIWKVQETKTVGTVKVAVPVSMWPGALTKPALLVSNTTTFDDTSIRTMAKETINGVDYYVVLVDFTSGDFFSFAGFITAPGGVQGAALWLKADNGVSYNAASNYVSTWNDQTANTAITTQATSLNSSNTSTVDNSIVWDSGAVNFNPSVVYNYNSGRRLQGYTSSTSTWSGALTIYGLAAPTGAGSFAGIFSSQFKTLARENNSGGWLWETDANGSTYYGAQASIPLNQPSLGIGIYKDNGLLNSRIYRDGTEFTSGTPSNSDSSPSNFFEIGGRTTGGQNARVMDGKIPEVIVYNANHSLSPLSMLRINSYLAIKYGTTLSRNNNGNSTSGEIISGGVNEGDYIASDESKFWTSDATYQNNIAGIGRDDASALNQKQSQSQVVNNGAQPIIGNIDIADTNANNANGFAADKTFMMWGSDSGSANFATPFPFGGLNSRMARIWKVQETGTVGKVRVAFKVSDLPGSVTKPTLLVSGDTTFDGTDQSFSMTIQTIGGVKYYVTALSEDINFSSGQYFSFAAFVTAPGGVLGTTSWFKADKGTTLINGKVSTWSNQASNSDLVQLTQQADYRQPAFTTKGWNFNPNITFDGSSDILDGTMSSLLNVLGSQSNDVFGILNLAGGDNAKVYLQISDDGGNNRLSLENTVMHFPTSSSYISNTGLAQNNFPSIFNAASGAGNLSYALNGGSNATGTFLGTITAGTTPRYMVGGFRAGSGYYHFISGNFPEMMTYNKTLTPTEKKQVQTYLAIKYGQTVLHDYLASDGLTTIYTISGYNNNIAGIGRDDASALNQKQSQSQPQSANTDIQPIIGNGDIADTNANNLNDFTADKSFLVWGSDAGSTTFSTPFAFGSSNYRTTRVWKVQETGTVGLVKVAIPASQLPIRVSKPSLLISGDAAFDGNDTPVDMELKTIGGVQYYVTKNSVDFISGQFFSFAGFVTAPGGVLTNLTFWTKADAGTTTTTNNATTTNWVNQVTGVASNGGNGAVYLNNNINFNPGLGFNGSQTFTFDSSDSFGMAGDVGNPSYAPKNFDMFAMIKPTNGGFYLCGRNGGVQFSLSTTGGAYLEVINGGVITHGNSMSSIPNILGFRRIGGGTVNQQYLNGIADGAATNNTYKFSQGSIGLGYWYEYNSAYLNGNMNEVIIYGNGGLTNLTDRTKVDSYLAVKYGITLGNTSNFVNYLHSTGGTIWTGDGNFQNNIAGIGRDDASALLQKQSQSTSTGSQLIIGLSTVATTNAANTGTLNNMQFLMWGDNNVAGTTSFTGIAGYNSRLNRVWKVQNTNAIDQDVQVLVPLTLVPSNSSLLCGSDKDFADNTYQAYNPVPGTVIINSLTYRVFTVPSSMISQASFYMTLAFYKQSPGGVRDPKLWLRGDAGLAGPKSWLDQSGDPDQNDLRWDISDCGGATSGQMELNSLLNFNKVASFNGGTWGHTQTSISHETSPDADVAIIYKANSAIAQDVWSTDFGGALDERSLTTTQVSNGNNGIAYPGGNSAAATINIASFNGFVAGGSNVVVNGDNRLNFTGNPRYPSCAVMRLGDIHGAGNIFSGLIGEYIVYNTKNMTSIERIQLNSYLALKYGITLGRNNDGDDKIGEVISGSIKEGDYLASDGNTQTWVSDAVYQNNVVGLGRDDISAFHQRITTSQSAAADIITLSTDSNFTNPNQSGTSGHTDIINDKYFFVTGNNNSPTSYTKTSGLSNGLNALMKRIWKVRQSGTAQDVYISTTDNLATYLVYSSNAAFSTDVTYVQLFGGATNGIKIPSGSYFTFATFMKWPGGVEDEVVWLRGDIGLTGAQTWLDQSGNSNNLRFDINDCMAGSAGQMTLGKTFNYNSVAGFGPGTGWTWGMIQADISRVSSPDADVAIMYKADAVKEQDVWGTDLGGILDERSLLTTKITNDNNSIGYSGGNSGYGTINMASFRNTVSDGSNVLINGNNVLNFTGSTTYNGCSVIRLGDVPGNREDYNPFTGVFGEFVVYKKNITATQRIQLNSYLALKYGITLGRDNDGDGTSGEDVSNPVKEGDYLASYDSTVRIWESDAVYQNNVIGIGRDDITALHQRITKSQMPVSDIITLSTDSNFTNNNQSGASGHTDIANDKYYFITGHNGEATSFRLKSGLNNSLSAIMNRVWKVQQNGTVQDVYVSVNNARATYLIYSDDPTFSSGVFYAELNNGITPGIRIPTSNYFTFAAPLTGPGGVTDNLARWYRADRDVTTGNTLTWADQTTIADAVQGVADNQPAYNVSGTSLLNFNQSFTFNATAPSPDFMSFSDAGLAYGDIARSVFGVGRTSVTGGTFEWLTSYGTSGVSGQNFGLMRSGDKVLVTTFGNDFYPYNSNSPYASNTPVLSYGAASVNTIYGTYNALPIKSGTYTVNTVLNTGMIGTRQSGGENWNGIIGEVVYYNKIPNSNEKQRIDSYLGLKYGVTLVGSTTTPFDYMDSASKIFWTGDTTYQNNIAGIGRDDISDLIQKQSQSVNSGDQVIIGLGSVVASNNANTGSFENNRQFLVWGDNNILTGATTAFTSVYPYQDRLTRVWKVQNTNNLSKDIQVLIPANYIKNLKISSLLYSTDATFATNNRIYTSNGTVTVNSVSYSTFTIPAAQVNLDPNTNTAVFYFTMAYYKKSPGGVVGENLWLRADDGVSATVDDTAVAQWNDQSTNNSHGTQATPAKQPVYKNNAANNMNFNPVLAFSSTASQNFDIAGDLGIGNQPAVAAFAVSDTPAGAGARYFLEPKGTGNNMLQFRSSAPGSAMLSLSNGTSVSNTLAGIGSSVLYSGWRTTGNLFSGVNGNPGTSLANATSWTAGSLALGAAYNQTTFTTGKIPEVAEYSKALTPTELRKVNSYLALKYGITMDQSTAQDYLASDGYTSWTADNTYKYNIAGIGRDDLTALNQKQSQSVNTGSLGIDSDSQMLVALGAAEATNTANNNTFSSDMQYLVWGNDNGLLSAKVTTGNITANGLTYSKRFSRVWKVQNKGNFADKIGIYYPVSAFGSAAASSVGLIYASTAAKLNDGTASVIANSGKETINGTDYYAFYVSGGIVPSLNYMSFATATSVCYKPPVTTGAPLDTKLGISTLDRAGADDADNWPMVRKGGWIALEAQTKGMVINRVRFKDFGTQGVPDLRPVADDDTTPILTSPVEGMIVMDLSNRALKVYTTKDGGVSYGWYVLSKQACPD
ncbi:discoidin domain-containing protein [Epilithonimonas caeni]|uniref:discoidin domain-containing protein n=1 Tax=Epilithonimonas caeni TaxID=365343 RepID=UPI000410AFC4|nr:discoidin domain-containing protein [Epilithonimonas caeni]